MEPLQQSLVVNFQHRIINLESIVPSLRLAYVGSDTFPCNQQVVAVGRQFSQLLSNSSLKCGSINYSVMEVINSYSQAFCFIKRGQYENAFKIFEASGNLAITISNIFQELVDLYDQAEKQVEEAYTAANKDCIEYACHMRNIITELNQLRPKQDELTNESKASVQEDKLGIVVESLGLIKISLAKVQEILLEIQMKWQILQQHSNKLIQYKGDSFQIKVDSLIEDIKKSAFDYLIFGQIGLEGVKGLNNVADKHKQLMYNVPVGGVLD